MKKDELTRVVWGMVVFGCIWGFLEAVTFAGMLHKYWSICFPYHICPCFLMAAVLGSFVMGSALAVHKKPLMLLGVGVVATASGWLSVPFLPEPVRANYYEAWIPSATGIVVGALSLALVASFLMKRMGRSVPVRVGAGMLSGLLASAVFIVVTEYGVDKGIVATLGYARALPDFLGVGGIWWMVAQAIMLPLGYLVGEKREELRSWLFPDLQKRHSLGYVSLVAIIALCSGGAIAFMIGL